MIIEEVDRVKMKFNGTGPRIHERPGKIWPRDEIIAENECRKIFFGDIGKKIGENKPDIERFLCKLFHRLSKCNVNHLFQKTCPLDPGFFDKRPFEIHYALEAYTSYDKVMSFVHSVLQSINRGSFLKSLFGSHRNFSIFKRHIKWLVIGNAKLRKIKIHDIVFTPNQNMDLDQLVWLNHLEPSLKHDIFLHVIAFLTRFIYNLLRRYFYITHGGPFMHKIFYYRYNLWQKMQDLQLKNLTNLGIIEMYKCEESVGLPNDELSKIKFHLKKDGLRLICTRQLPRNCKVSSKIYDKAFKKTSVFKYILSVMPNYKPFKLNDLLLGLRYFRKQSIEENKEIYFVRADIKNCFPSINQEKLRNIILGVLRDNLKNDCIELNRISHEKRKTHGYGAKRTIVRKELIVGSGDYLKPDLKFTVDGSAQVLSLEEFDTNLLRPHLLNPVLKVSQSSKNYYNLRSGIRQGSKFSTVLNSIYIVQAFNEYLGDMMNLEDTKIFRYVDDILFVSTDLEKSKEFMRRMLRGFTSFDLKMNVDKLACNFDFVPPDIDLCKLTDYLVFYKRRICLETLQCSSHFEYNDVDLSATFNASPYDSMRHMQTAIRTTMIEPINLDCQLNGLDGVVKNLFEHSLLIAHRIATLLLVSFEFRSQGAQSFDRISDLIRISSLKIMQAIRVSRQGGIIENDLDYFQVRLITTCAFLSTWTKSRMRHRKDELDKLRSIYRRYRHKFLIMANDHETGTRLEDSAVYEQKDVFIGMLNKFKQNFSKSDFCKQILLPKKA